MSEGKKELQKMERELKHLEKAHRSGIVNKKEYEDNKAKLVKKINKLSFSLQNEAESRKIINDILSQKPASDKGKEMAKKESKTQSKTKAASKPVKEKPKPAKKVPAKTEAKKTKAVAAPKVTKKAPVKTKATPKPVKQEKKEAQKEPTAEVKVINREPKREFNVVQDIPKVEVIDYSSDRKWNVAIYLLVILLILAVIFTGYRFYTMQGHDDTVVIYEFSDFESPNARDVQNELREVKDEFSDQVKIIYKHFPLDANEHAMLAAQAAECAALQGEFSKMHNILFNAQNSLSKELIYSFGAELGLDVNQYTTCLDSEQTKDLVLEDIAEGKSKGVEAVPTFLIGDEMLVGNQDFKVFEHYIKKELR